MTRIDRLLAGIDKTMAGLEVAPWLAPIAAKRDGYNIRILDVFDRATLLSIGEGDPNQVGRDMSRLEDVDFVGSATEIASLVPADQHGGFDYIISSHNFEHLPNPIKFLAGCGTLLKPGGVVSMVVPDRRATFDFFRPHTAISDWIEAYQEGRAKPTLKQVFEHVQALARLNLHGEDRFAHSVGRPLALWRCIGDLGAAWQGWEAGRKAEGSTYVDCHCTIMTPASLELLLLEARYLGLIGLEVESISETVGFEFFVRLRKPRDGHVAAVQDINQRRTTLMRRILEEYRVQNGRALLPGEEKLHGNFAARLHKASRRVRRLGRRLRGKPDRS